MSVLEERGTITEYEYRQRKKREQEEKERQERAIQKEINSVLDKIRVEISEKSFEVPYKNQAFDYGIKLVALQDVRHILDKYKGEVEK